MAIALVPDQEEVWIYVRRGVRRESEGEAGDSKADEDGKPTADEVMQEAKEEVGGDSHELAVEEHVVHVDNKGFVVREVVRIKQ